MIKEDRVNVTLHMIHGNQRNLPREAQRLGIGDTDQQGANQSRPGCHCNGAQVVPSGTRLFHRLTYHRNNGPQMFARGKLRNHAAILHVHIKLRSYHARPNLATICYHSSRGLVA